MKHQSHRFTLLELIIVIAILLLLFSLLYPSMRRARELSRAVVCGSNDMQIGVANSLYMRDNKGQVIPYCTGKYAYGETESWDLVIFRYLQNYKPMQCPSDKFSLKRDVVGVGKNLFRSYSITGSFTDQYHPLALTNVNYTRSRRMSTIPNPTQTVAIIERRNHHNVEIGPWTGQWRNGSEADYTSMIPWYHGKLTPMLFADGHMSLIKKTNGTAIIGGVYNSAGAGGYFDPTPIAMPGYGYSVANGADMAYGAALPQ